MIESEANGHL